MAVGLGFPCSVRLPQKISSSFFGRIPPSLPTALTHIFQSHSTNKQHNKEMNRMGPVIGWVLQIIKCVQFNLHIVFWNITSPRTFKFIKLIWKPALFCNKKLCLDAKREMRGSSNKSCIWTTNVTMTPKLADCVNFERFTTSISDTDREVNFAGLNLFVSVKVSSLSSHCFKIKLVFFR